MAERVQVLLPKEMTPMIMEIKAAKALKFEPTTNTAIVIDAVKKLHQELVEKA